MLFFVGWFLIVGVASPIAYLVFKDLYYLFFGAYEGCVIGLITTETICGGGAYVRVLIEVVLALGVFYLGRKLISASA